MFFLSSATHKLQNTLCENEQVIVRANKLYSPTCRGGGGRGGDEGGEKETNGQSKKSGIKRRGAGQ